MLLLWVPEGRAALKVWSPQLPIPRGQDRLGSPRSPLVHGPLVQYVGGGPSPGGVPEGPRRLGRERLQEVIGFLCSDHARLETERKRERTVTPPDRRTATRPASLLPYLFSGTCSSPVAEAGGGKDSSPSSSHWRRPTKTWVEVLQDVRPGTQGAPRA